jgi:hypothetical protein
MNPLLSGRFSYNNGQIIRTHPEKYQENMKNEFLYVLRVQTGIHFDENNYTSLEEEHEDREQDIGTNWCICGQIIKKLCIIVYKDGTSFQVGNECVNKVSKKLKAGINGRLCSKCGEIYDKRGHRSQLRLCKKCYDNSGFESLFLFIKFHSKKQKEKENKHRDELIKIYKKIMVKMKTHRKSLLMLKPCKKCNQLNINKYEKNTVYCYPCQEPIKVLLDFIKYHLIKIKEELLKKQIYDNEIIMFIFDSKKTFRVKEIIKEYDGSIWKPEEKKWYIKRKNYEEINKRCIEYIQNQYIT